MMEMEVEFEILESSHGISRWEYPNIRKSVKNWETARIYHILVEKWEIPIHTFPRMMGYPGEIGQFPS
jgi:hypothetical protein